MKERKKDRKTERQKERERDMGSGKVSMIVRPSSNNKNISSKASTL